MITVYLDMDGVLANFDKSFRQYKTEHVEDHIRFRDAVMLGNIFEDLEIMPGAYDLLNAVKMLHSSKIDVQILTSVGTFDVDRGNAAKQQKLLWLEKHGIMYKANFVRTKPEKSLYAHKFCILIDDSIGCVEPFIKKGGVGILHNSRNVRDTLYTLDKTITNMVSTGAMA